LLRIGRGIFLSNREEWTAPQWNALISRQAKEDGARVILNTMVPDRYFASVEAHLITHFQWRESVERRAEERRKQRKRNLLQKIKGRLE